MGLLHYGDVLERKILNAELIPENSLMECEIRSAAIVACDEIVKRSGCNINDLDTYLWENRKACDDPFHLNVTTNY